MGENTPFENACNQASPAWHASPEVVARKEQIATILDHLGALPDAEGMTLALQAFNALDAQQRMPQVEDFMRDQKLWPFDGNK